MLIKLSDETRIEVEAERDEIRMVLSPPGTWPFTVTTSLDTVSCQELMRALAMKLKEAEGW